MKHLFVPYEQALALKELGFDEPCFGFYCDEDEYERLGDFVQDVVKRQDFFMNQKASAPLFSQAFKWFREKHKLFGSIGQSGDEDDKYSFRIYQTYYPHTTVGRGGEYDYEGAELACLKKLIELKLNS